MGFYQQLDLLEKGIHSPDRAPHRFREQDPEKPLDLKLSKIHDKLGSDQNSFLL